MFDFLGRPRGAAVLATASAIAIVAAVSPAQAQEQQRTFNIPAQPLSSALLEFSRQADVPVTGATQNLNGLQAPAVQGEFTPTEALNRLIAGSGLAVSSRPDGGFILADNTSPTRLGAPETGAEEEIVVTGSNIRGAASASPIVVLDRDRLDALGVASADAAVKTLPQAFAGGNQRDTTNALDQGQFNLGRGSGANLRGLGTGGTLVLVDGRRLPAESEASFVDLSLFPYNAISRIEVLTDGASATYGSDAIAGVVNVILREDFRGIGLDGRYAAATRGGYDERGAGIIGGVGSERGNLLVSYQYLDQSNLAASERAFSAATVAPTDLLGSALRHDAMVRGRLSLTDHTEAFALLLGSTRETNFTYRRLLADPVRVSHSETEQFLYSAGIGHDFANGWRGEFSIGDGENDVLNYEALIGTTHQRITNGVTTYDARFDGPLGAIAGRDIRLAMGMGRRDESADLIDTASPNPRRAGDRSVDAVYAELFVPVVGPDNSMPGIRLLELSGAVRYESYSDFGETVNPKLGIRWAPFDGLRLRATYGTSFRAPTFQQSTMSPEFDGLLNLPDASAPGGTRLTLVRINGSNPDLDPETAQTLTIGLDASLSRNWSATLNYFSIDYEDRIQRPLTNVFTVYQNAGGLAPFIDYAPDLTLLAQLTSVPFTGSSGFVNLSGGPLVLGNIQAVFDNRFQNISSVRTTGFDASLSYLPSDGRGLFGSISATYISDFEFEAGGGAPGVSFLNTLGNPLRLRTRADLGYSGEGWSVGAAVNYANGYDNRDLIPVSEVDSWTTVDARAQFDLGQLLSESLADSVILLNVHNILDEDPPRVAGSSNFFVPIGYDPSNASPLGRVVSLQVRTRF